MKIHRRWKEYAFVVGVIFTVITLPLIIHYANSRTKAVINLKVPEGYKIGELVILDASASKADELIWKIIPDTSDFKVVGKTAFFSSTKPIKYTLILVARNGKDLACRIFTIPYDKKVKEVEVEVEVEVVSSPFEKQVKSWLKDTNRRGAALRLAQSFRIIARTIDSGVFTDVDNLILATAWANTEALSQDLEAWKPFLLDFQSYLENNPPTTIKDHVAIWVNLAAALEKIFGAPC